MLGYSPSWRYNRICNEKIRFKHDRHAFFRYHPCCISRDNDLTSAIRYHHPSRFFKRGMGNFKQYYLEPDQIKRFIEAHIMSHRIHEGEIIQYIIKRVLKTINIYSILYPVKIPESCIMIVMGMRPDHPINMTDLFLKSCHRRSGLVSIRSLLPSDSTRTEKRSLLLFPPARASRHVGQEQPILGVPTASPVPSSVIFIHFYFSSSSVLSWTLLLNSVTPRKRSCCVSAVLSVIR